jgi:hypothetical protein
VVIVENKVNLLTVPPGCYAMALGGLGSGLSLFRYVPWLAMARVSYWGDLDVEGLAILSSLRVMFPHAQSVLMDDVALAALRHLAIAGTGRACAVPPHLTQGERSAFALCAEQNLRIEQERIPQLAVVTAFSGVETTSGRGSGQVF